MGPDVRLQYHAQVIEMDCRRAAATASATADSASATTHLREQLATSLGRDYPAASSIAAITGSASRADASADKVSQVLGVRYHWLIRSDWLLRQHLLHSPHPLQMLLGFHG